MTKAELAKDLFKKGYNCAQSVAAVFSEELGLEFDTVLKLVSPFGGGMGRMREVCGAVSGMFFVVGKLYGYTSPNDAGAKKDTYTIVQTLAEQVKEKTGSIICRELLNSRIAKDTSPVPSLRTKEYYANRSCTDIVGIAAETLDEYIKQHAY